MRRSTAQLLSAYTIRETSIPEPLRLSAYVLVASITLPRTRHQDQSRLVACKHRLQPFTQGRFLSSLVEEEYSEQMFECASQAWQRLCRTDGLNITCRLEHSVGSFAERIHIAYHELGWIEEKPAHHKHYSPVTSRLTPSLDSPAPISY